MKTPLCQKGLNSSSPHPALRLPSHHRRLAPLTPQAPPPPPPIQPQRPKAAPLLVKAAKAPSANALIRRLSALAILARRCSLSRCRTAPMARVPTHCPPPPLRNPTPHHHCRHRSGGPLPLPRHPLTGTPQPVKAPLQLQALLRQWTATAKWAVVMKAQARPLLLLLLAWTALLIACLPSLRLRWQGSRHKTMAPPRAALTSKSLIKRMPYLPIYRCRT